MEVSNENTLRIGMKAGKAPRRRKKATYSKIRDQMEFYFSDANLHKDRFLKKSIESTKDGYIPLDVFLSFNKIKCLTNDVAMVADALDKKSELLQLNTERTHVKRVTPIEEPKNVDERTVYVECLPHHVDHEWVKKLFSSCGKVVYVSLPKYPSTGDPKGFGFVEFETIEAAQDACKELNNPPAEDLSGKIGMFPKTSHQLDSIKKKLPKEEIDKTVEQVKEEQTLEDISVTNEDRNEIVTDTEQKEDDCSKETKLKRHRTNSESDSAANNSDASPTKRRKSDVAFDLPTEEQKVVDEKSGKKKSRKRKSRSKTLESEESKGESDLEKGGETAPEKKQRLDEQAEPDNDSVDDQNKKQKLSKDGEEADNNELKSADKVEKGKQGKESSTKKKNRFRRKKDKKEKEFPELRVLPKTDWLQLREEYLKLQKASMALLKRTLGEVKDSKKGVGKKPERKAIEFKPDVIVKVTSEEPMKRTNLKNALGEGYKIAYIDVIDDATDGYIRCSNTESAKQIGAVDITGYTFAPITGDEEKQYWDKLTLQREEKLSSKSRHKKRGHQKWTEKAQKASVENTERKHIVFDED